MAEHEDDVRALYDILDGIARGLPPRPGTGGPLGEIDMRVWGLRPERWTDREAMLTAYEQLVTRAFDCPYPPLTWLGSSPDHARVIHAFVPVLACHERLSAEDMLRALLADERLWSRWCGCDRGTVPREPRQSSKYTRLQDAAISLLIERVLDQDVVSQSEAYVLLGYCSYEGFAHFAAALRWLDRDKPPRSNDWATHLLEQLPPPTEDDVAGLANLPPVRPETLFVAAAFNPVWAANVESTALDPSRAGLAAFGTWARFFTEPSRWATDVDGRYRVEWGQHETFDQRAVLREVIDLQGAKLLKRAAAHPVFRSRGRAMPLALAATLGKNWADVEAKFLDRDKWAAVALGMLPDEGDLADRYLALCRYGEGLPTFGLRRLASEARAARIGIAQLAATAGYDDVDAFEWAIERQIGGDDDPATRRWAIGGYDVWIESDDRLPIRVARSGTSLASIPTAVREAADFDDVLATRARLLAQQARVRRRLERALVSGEMLDRAAFEQVRSVPIGRVLLPQLVLRVWPAEAPAPIEILAARDLDGQPFDLETVTAVQISHPLHLAAAGTLDAWQRRVVRDSVTQPLDQLFRAVYEPSAEEQTERSCRRYAGRRVIIGSMRQALKRVGWEAPSYYAGFVRRLDADVFAELRVEGNVTTCCGNEPVALGMLVFHGRSPERRPERLDPLRFSEAVREVDLAMSSAMPDKSVAAPSSEVLTRRAALVRAYLPAATQSDDLIELPEGAIHLATGAAFDIEGRPRRLPKLPVPSPFPVPDPDPVVATIVARALYLAGDDRCLAASQPRRTGKMRIPRPKRPLPARVMVPV